MEGMRKRSDGRISLRVALLAKQGAQVPRLLVIKFSADVSKIDRNKVSITDLHTWDLNINSITQTRRRHNFERIVFFRHNVVR